MKRRPHLIERAAGQSGPGQPVHGQLDRGVPAGRRVGRRFAGLPVHHCDSAVGIGEHRVDAAADHGAGRALSQRQLEGHLHVQRGARRPRRGAEGGPQRVELLTVGVCGVARAGQVVEVEEPLGAVEPLHPVVEGGAQQGVRVGPGGQPPGQPARGGGGVAVEFDQRADRQRIRQRPRRRIGGAGAFGQQGVDVGDPAVRVAGVGGRPGHRRCHQLRPALHLATATAQRVDRPHRLNRVVPQWVRLPLGGFGFPVRDLPAAGGLDDVADLDQEVRRAARGGFGGAPVMPGQQQGVLGAGQRDVEQSAFLVYAAGQQLVAVGVDEVFEGFAVADRGGVQQWDAVSAQLAVLGIGAVTAQQWRQVGRVGEPGALGGRRREHPGAQVRHRHDLPFQAFGGVDGEDLHPPRRGADLGRRQTVLHHRGGIQIGQQAGDVGAGVFGVAGDDVGEPVQVLGPGAGGADFGVHPEQAAHLGGQVAHRVGQEAAQPDQFGAQCGDPPVALRRVDLRRAGVGQRVGQRCGVGVGGRRDDLAGREFRGPPPLEQQCPPPQCGEIPRAQAPARPGQHLDGGSAGRRVGDHSQHRNHLRHFGDGEQAGQSDDLHRDAAQGQRRGDRAGVGVAAHQHRRGGRLLPLLRGGGIPVGDLLGHPVPLGGDVVVQRAPHIAGLGPGSGPQWAHRHRTPAGLLGDGVGQLQHPRRVAPAGAQLQGGRRCAVRQREVGGEPRQVGGRGAAPAVDGLDRITHGGQRQTVIDAAAEQCRQRDALGVPGVLVFIQQHHPVAGP